MKKFKKANSVCTAMVIGVVVTGADGSRTLSQRLKAPCAVTGTYYPFRTCRISENDAECGKGFNAFATMDECCNISFGDEGCTNLDDMARCWVPGEYFPETSCVLSSNPEECKVDWGHWKTWKECCEPGSGAFDGGCSAPKPCFVAKDYYPEKICGSVTDQDICLRGWGTFKDYESCCEPGAAFDTGCGTA